MGLEASCHLWMGSFGVIVHGSTHIFSPLPHVKILGMRVFWTCQSEAFKPPHAVGRGIKTPPQTKIAISSFYAIFIRVSRGRPVNKPETCNM